MRLGTAIDHRAARDTRSRLLDPSARCQMPLVVVVIVVDVAAVFVRLVVAAAGFSV